MKLQFRVKIFVVLSLALCSAVMAQPSWKWAIVDSLPHPVGRFTQGLSWDGQTLWESTGMVGRSTLYHMDRRAKVLDSVSIAEPHFGEGSVRVRDDVFVLTWQSGIGFIYDAKTLRKKGEFSLPTDGWGLTQKDGLLWMSNGTSDILQLTADSQELVGRLRVQNQGRPVERFNELEMTSSYLLANIWYSDSVAVIQPRTGQVEAWLNLAAISKTVHSKDHKADVLNGLAWDGKLLWVTGKLWPKIYALKIEKLK